MTVWSLDVSNYSGLCDFTGASLLGIRHVVVRLSTESPGRADIAIQQLQAANAVAMTTSGYSWAYWDEDPYDFGDRCMRLAVAAGTPLKYVWLDLEGNPPPAADVAKAWLKEFYLGIGTDQKAGIYTSPGWWINNGDTYLAMRGKKKIPLWLAHYDGIPKLTSQYLPMMLPWKQIAAKQYKNDTTFAGILCDMNVFGKEYA